MSEVVCEKMDLLAEDRQSHVLSAVYDMAF